MRTSKRANPAIVDVEVVRPIPGHIHITPLMQRTVFQDDAVDAGDLNPAYLSPETAYRMGDYVSVRQNNASNL
ncbi:MAG: hypothetical protein U5K75_02230 [Ahrensia sp.]|nr:hypothetical protein [Ahrensia sp.]